VTPRLLQAGAHGSVALLPAEPGVYRFRDASDRVLYIGRAVDYIGRAVDLRRRVGSYWSNLGTRSRLRRMVERIVDVEVVVCDSDHEAAWLERNLLERMLPRWNRARGGSERAAFSPCAEGERRSRTGTGGGPAARGHWASLKLDVCVPLARRVG